MKILAILAALLASTAIVTAEPKLGAVQPSRATLDAKKAESTGRVLLGDRKPRPPAKAPVLVDGWAEITDATPARFGTVFVRMGSAAGAFTKVRFDLVSGAVRFKRVEIHYADGTAKTFALAKSLNARRQPSTVIDLGGAKRIEQIDVTTDRRPTGEYAIYGLAGTMPNKPTCC